MKPWLVLVGLVCAAGAALVGYKVFKRLRRPPAPPPPVEAPAPPPAPKGWENPPRDQAVMDNLDSFDGFIMLWVCDGPYTEEGKDGRALFDTVFPPETKEQAGCFWKPLIRGVGTWEIDLEDGIAADDNCVGYMKTRIKSPAAMDALLQVGSDDGVKVWLNGEVVHANNAQRGLVPPFDILDIKLREGWNDIMLKVTDCTAGWATCCRIRHTDGTAIDGLELELPEE
jgi:hypothetical protein